MAIHKASMKSIIKRNGHLILEGNESKEDLRIALIYLCGHFRTECHRPELGTPIEELVLDITWLTPDRPARPRKSVKTADISTDVL